MQGNQCYRERDHERVQSRISVARNEVQFREGEALGFTTILLTA